MLIQDEKKLEAVIMKLNLATKEQVDSIRIESVRSGKGFEEVAVSMGVISKEDLVKAKSISYEVPYVDLRMIKANQDLLKMLPKDISKKYQAVPFGVSGNMINIAMMNPNDVQAIEFIERKTNMRVNPYLASEDSIANILGQYADLSSEVKEAIRSFENQKNDDAQSEVKKEQSKELNNLVQDAPVTRAVNTILEYASKSRASDIHIEPWEKALKVRYRIDGVLVETMSLPIHIQAALVSRIKILSDLKIDEHRIPQDGRFDVNFGGHEIDIRVAISPTVNGEKVVMRLLDKSGGVIDLEKLGIRGRAFRLIQEGIKKPHGMVLSTGPTGSGKSTTLYAILTKLNTPDVNIITLEDPVEYQVAGVNQIQTNASVGLTFAAGLRSILRQDPDVIMVGEIRDSETADLAVQSALTGHTVLSTLHTNSAAGLLPRLLDMEIEPFLIASTVSTVIGQRLVRKLCEKCRKATKSGPALTEMLNKIIGPILPKTQSELDLLGYKNTPKSGTTSFTVWEPVGCPECNNTGFMGRIGIYEVFVMDPEIEKLVVSRGTTSDIQALVLKKGMITMQQDGFLKVLEGITTPAEVIAKAIE